MRFGLAILPLLLWSTMFAQGPENILLIVNKGSRDSRAVAEYYQAQRKISATNVCTIQTFDQEEIGRAFFEDEIQKPIAACITKRRFQDQILYIVLTRGLPLKIKGEQGGKEDYASVDSELTLLYQFMLGVKVRTDGNIPNPYFGAHTQAELPRFSHLYFPIYLVTRLDAYDIADVKALIDRGLRIRRAETAAATQGRFIFDLNYDDQSEGNRWLRDAAVALGKAGVPEARIQLETSQKFLSGEKDVLGYASWGSNDRANPARVLGNQWVDGALASEYVSTNGRTFEKPPESWKTGKWSDPPATMFAGSPQGLIGDYIHEGVTGISGNVYEPYLQGCARPQILFSAYVRGHNLAESFYAALPYLSWQSIVIGDPLVAIVSGAKFAAGELRPPLDPATQLPRFFAARLAATRTRQKESPKK
jgi:uncharacterized protein (TIGR03790 family)